MPNRKKQRKNHATPSRSPSPQHQPQSVVVNVGSSYRNDERAPLLRETSPARSRCDSHTEHHFQGAEVIRDVVVGLSDGLTVPFALTAGLASLGNSRFVVLAGMAEIVAGAISMGLGGYLAGKSEIEHYESEYAREQREVIELPEREEEEILEIFEPYELDRKALQPLLDILKANPVKWVEFMMKYELNLEKPDASRVWVSALTIGGSYFMGGLVPLIPYMLIEDSLTALLYSIGCTLLVLLVFGYVKGRLVGVSSPVRSAFEMMIVGAVASGAAFGIAKAMPQPESFRFFVNKKKLSSKSTMAADSSRSTFVTADSSASVFVNDSIVVNVDAKIQDRSVVSKQPPLPPMPAAKAVSVVDSHLEPHFGGAEIVRDIVVGLSDGLTVPFALTAGLASLGNSRFVVLAGMAEIVAGSISMGLGGYLAGRSEIEHYESEYAREQKEIIEVPEKEEAEIMEIFEPYGMSKESITPLLNVLKANPTQWVEFMMKYELNLEKPDGSRVWISALTIGGSYFIGGLVPLIPYMCVQDSYTALYISIGCTLLVLFIFGFVKGKVVGVASPLRSALEMMIVGGVASGAAFGIAKAMPQP
ncbi:UNVERIFIED_CONTAM: hypothetical protein HDU68_008803 [Siphonaria sp. JEL0065]|nr:hypothetical protein HDU68_008803 [Siphonaria sp. JEL0065]